MDAGEFIDLAHDAALRHREELSEDDLKYLGALEYVWEGDGFVAAHGDFTDPPAFNYVDGVEPATANFAAVRHQLMFVGHTHVPSLALTGASGAVYVAPAQDFALEEGKRYIVNPGSVGYPRETDGKCLSSYAIYDADSRSVFFRYIPFTVDSMLQRGRPKRRRGLFLALASALALAVTAAGYFALAPSAQPDLSEVEAALVLKSAEVEVKEREKVVADLVLANDSPGVELKMEFFGKSGEVLGFESLTVKKSNRRRYSVPAGAIKAVFTLLKCRENENPKVEKFSPRIALP
jgi:diadenosine tetraphosphatase ApaH/serine/threonine PP2A family protein phosphatase